MEEPVPRMMITQHAAERYRKRIDPSASIPEAFAALETAAERARPERQKTRQGHALYCCDDPPVKLVVKRGRMRGEGLVCVTVIPRDEVEQHEAGLAASLLKLCEPGGSK
jgi:hypothetical protein